jgi:photosystem II stability/assembly factor-like uncharacterized protein
LFYQISLFDKLNLSGAAMKFHTSLLMAAITFIQFNTFSQWVYQQAPAGASYYITVEFSNSQIGTVGGVFLTSEFLGRAAYTTNGGLNWLAAQVPDSARVLIEIKFINNVTGYCAGACNTNTLYNPVNLSDYNKRTLQKLNSSLPDAGGNNKGLFLKTTNSGQSWFTYGTLPANVYYLLGLYFVNSTTGYTIASYDPFGGVNDGVLKTTNGGLSWQPLSMPENINSLSGIYFSDLNTGYAVGYDRVSDTNRGVILKTTNAGINWNRQIFVDVNEFSSVDFSNPSTGIAVTLSGNPITGIPTGRAYKTTNAGVNWSIVFAVSDVELQGVKFVQGSGTALIYGTRYIGPDFKEYLSKTTNYGSSWAENILNDTGAVFVGTKLLDLNNWYTTGGDFNGPARPLILHTTNGGSIGIIQISNEVPDRFSLSQNYPNPFNPATNVKFQIPNAGFVRLIVFDILGREVSTLVNEELKAGTYEVNWGASAYPSDVYFYRLDAGDFSTTKKMLLLK